MMERGIRRAEVPEAILSGDEIEDYPTDRPFSSGLFLGWIGLRPLHVVVAYDPEGRRAYVITAYEPDLHISNRAFEEGELHEERWWRCVPALRRLKAARVNHLYC
jgi:hypothetical protein